MSLQAYEGLAGTVLASGTGSVVFSSIPATFRDLKVIVSARSAESQALYLRFNGDVATNYSTTWFAGTTSAVSSLTTNETFANISATGALNTDWHVWEIDIMSYASSSNKTLLSRGAMNNTSHTAGSIQAAVSTWRSTAAITSLTFTASTGTIAASSVFTVFGIGRL